MGNTATSKETIVSKSLRLQKSRRAINVSLAWLVATSFSVGFAALALVAGGEGSAFPPLFRVAIGIVQVTAFIGCIFVFVNTVISHFELLAEPNDSPE